MHIKLADIFMYITPTINLDKWHSILDSFQYRNYTTVLEKYAEADTKILESLGLQHKNLVLQIQEKESKTFSYAELLEC